MVVFWAVIDFLFLIEKLFLFLLFGCLTSEKVVVKQIKVLWNLTTATTVDTVQNFRKENLEVKLSPRHFLIFTFLVTSPKSVI